MASFSSPAVSPSKKWTALHYVLVFSFALFIGILIVCYLITRQAHPIMLDEHGKPVAAAPLCPVHPGGMVLRA
jgi:hypothetical protein